MPRHVGQNPDRETPSAFQPEDTSRHAQHVGVPGRADKQPAQELDDELLVEVLGGISAPAARHTSRRRRRGRRRSNTDAPGHRRSSAARAPA